MLLRVAKQNCLPLLGATGLPAELLNATKLIYTSAEQLRFTNAHTQP